MATEVLLSNLDAWLQAQPANTVNTPYELKIIGTEEFYYYSLKNILRNNSTKYVDLTETIIELPWNFFDWMFENCTTLIKSPVLVPSEESPEIWAYLARTFSGCTNLTTITNIPSGVKDLSFTFEGCSSLISVPQLPQTLQYLHGTFYGCSSLTSIPSIENTNITDMNDAFNGCASLTNPPVLPPNVTTMQGTFQNCTSLLSIPNIPNTVTNMQSCFKGCLGLTSAASLVLSENVTDIAYIFSGCTNLTQPILIIPETITDCYCAFAQTLIKESPKIFCRCKGCFYDNPLLETVYIKDFDASKERVSTNAFYKCSALKNFYVDNPYDLKDWLNFAQLDNWNNFPVIISTCNFYLFTEESSVQFSISNLGNNLITLNANTTSTPFKIDISDVSLSNYNSIKTVLTANSTKYVDLSATEIPDTITDLSHTFEGCSSLIVAPAISKNVVDLTETFKNCSNLEEIPVFEVPLSVLESDAQDCFYGCTSLTSIGIPAPEIEESDEWHLMMLNFSSNTVKGRVYDSEGNYETIPETTIIKDKLTLPIMTDELLFTSSLSEQDLIDLIEDVLEYRYSYFNKTVIPPNNKSFVMYAEEPNNFVSNINFGGGGSGSGIPLGSITAYYGTTDPADKNWLICDGRDTTGTDIELETYYPSLYEFLGGSNILPDLRECVPVGAGQNSTVTIGNHDIYTLGQFKDDQFQGHEHRMYNVSASWDNRNSRVSGGSWIYNLTTKDTGDIIDKANYGTARYGTTTHGKQVGVNWIIKATSSSDTYTPPSEEILQIEQYFDNGINRVKPDVYYWYPAVASATIPNIDNYDMVVLQMSYNNEAYTGAFSLVRNSDEDEVTMDIDSTNSTYKSKFKWSTGEITRVSQSLSIKYAICYPKNIFNSITKMN